MEATEIDYVVRCLERSRGQWKRISAESEVPYTTIKNLMQGQVKDPRNSTIARLAGYFRADAKAAA